MKAKTMTWLLCAALAMASSTPVLARHWHGGHYDHYRPYHRHHHSWGNDWGWFVGMSALAILPQVLYAQQMRSVSVPYQYDEVPSVSMTPINQAVVVSNNTVDDASQYQYQTAVANEVINRANDSTTASNSYAEAVRSLPANARVIQTASGTEYEWLGQRYHYDWQADLYRPLSQ